MKHLELRPYNDFDETNPETDFWTDGKKVYNRGNVLRGANPNTFLYDGIFGKDDRKCFCGESWIRDADVATFRVLNYTYAIDSNYVYTITGKVKNADIDSFEILDEGKSLLWYNRAGIPEYTFGGYAKDRDNIYYHNYEGKPKIIKKADVTTFLSLNDGYFGKDKNFIFGNGKIIKNANVTTWEKISKLPNSLYSKDNEKIFYGFWEIMVDYETFEVEIPKFARCTRFQIAKDKNNFYRNGEIITHNEFEEYKSQNTTLNISKQ